MMGGRWELAASDAAYPDLLARTPDPPKTLYGSGDMSLLSSPCLAVIGARKATPYGLECARRFATWSASVGITVISGGAIGCDMAAHQAALDAGGRTVAVLGCGADVDYPSRAVGLLRSLRAEHLVVSEMPWGGPPQRWAFARRNRIIAGLSLAVLVVEAGLPSGTFGTADHALDAGREVLAVPGSILAPECRGSNRLIRQGCTPITCESELLEAMVSAGYDITVEAPDDQTTVFSARDPLVRALTANPMRPDDIAFQMGCDVLTVVRQLSRLEVAGMVVKIWDGRYTVASAPR